MELRKNIGRNAMDTITGIRGKISAVMYAAGDDTEYRVEYVDKNGCPGTLWIPVERVSIDEIACDSIEDDCV